MPVEAVEMPSSYDLEGWQRRRSWHKQSACQQHVRTCTAIYHTDEAQQLDLALAAVGVARYHRAAQAGQHVWHVLEGCSAARRTVVVHS